MISTPAVLDTCRRCGHLILIGQSEGLTTRANPQPLTPEQELAAILAGHATYDLQPLGLPRRPYLWHRHSFRISRGKREWKVVADHTCPPGPHIVPPPGKPIRLEIPYAAATPDQPPF